MSSHPMVVGIPTNTTVTLVPTIFLKTPEMAVANVAPSAIIATIHAN